MNTSLAGALVDCTIVIVAFLAWRIDPSLQNVFLGILCSMAGARVSMIRKPPGGGAGGLAANSAAMALLVGAGYAAAHLLGRGSHHA